jgi:hypothetical protein
MALDLAALVAGVVETLRAAGVRATSDPRGVNAPCVLVMPPTITHRMAGADASLVLYAIAGDAGAPAATSALSQLLDGVRAAFGNRVGAAAPVDVVTLDGGTLPGYSLTLTARRIPT